MSIDPRTPVIVGVAQINQHPEDPAEAVEAVALMTQVVKDAASNGPDGAGSAALLAELDAIAVVAGAWRYPNPAELIAQGVGASSATTILSHNGGNTPQSLLNGMAKRIQEGDLSAVAIVGAETIWSRRRQKKLGLTSEVTIQENSEPDEMFQADVAMSTDFEIARGMQMPINFYPLVESAIRANNGESIQDHKERVTTLWAGFNEVAVKNPYGWNRTAMTAEEIATPGPKNRMVGAPYTKAMNSNWDLDQAAAVILCTVEKAEAMGIERDRWVFPLAGTDGHDTYSISQRRDLHSSPAIHEAGKALGELSGFDLAEADYIDLYSCFPSAVQVGAAELGLSLDRQVTQTGGLTFAGGPLNNYVMHSIATTISLLRQNPGTTGLVTANGGYLTKHALGLYSTTPPEGGYKFKDVQEEIDAYPTVEVDEAYSGPAVIEAYTVMHSADGPEQSLAALRTPEGKRTWGNSDDHAVANALLAKQSVGLKVELAEDGSFSLL